MALLRVVGLDPSLRNWGIANGTYDTESHKIAIHSLSVVHTEKTKRKQLRQNTQDIEAAIKLMTEVHAVVNSADVVFVEVPVGSQSARAALGVGVCVGILGALTYLECPFFQLTPTEIKVIATGSKTATKQEMIDWAIEQHPSAPWPTQKYRGKLRIVTGTAEHMADAIAAIHAGVSSTPFKQLSKIQLTNIKD